MILRVVLLIEQQKLRDNLRRQLASSDIVFEQIRPGKRAWERVIRRGADVIIISQSTIPEPVDGNISVLADLPEVPTTVVISGSESVEEHAILLAAGCDTVLYAGLPAQRIVDAIQSVLDSRHQLVQQDLAGRKPAYQPRLADFVSESPRIQMFMATVRRIVPSSSSLLILGETGVGKEHLARAIHAEGPRSARPFVAINCAALPEQLLESELFGHEEGAFTGATRNRRGAFEMAHEGTIFLDEIGEMPLQSQAKLLRVLQDFEVRRVGGERTTYVDVRVIAASNDDLEAESHARRFRRDLFYRLSVVTLTVPSLRQRREDIPALVADYIARLSMRIGRDVGGIAADALDRLCRHNWPGNVRELINVIERAMLLCEGDEITLGDLPARIAYPEQTSISALTKMRELPAEWRGKTLHEIRDGVVEDVERAYLTMILTETGGQVGLAAQRAGIHSRGLYDKMRKYGLRKEEFREGGSGRD